VSRYDGEWLADTIDAIASIRAYQKRGDLIDGLIFDAIRLRLIEIGEAVKRVAPATLALRARCSLGGHRRNAGPIGCMAKSKAPACLAVPSSFAKSKSGLGCDAIDQNLCSPNGVAQAGPRSIRCDEMRSVLRLVGVGDTSKLDMVAYAFRRSFNHEIDTVEGALPRRKDAMTVG
jgi:hypothetical protein